MSPSELVCGPEPRPDVPTPGMHIRGWTCNVELEWLMVQAAEMGSVAEVGSLHGRSSFALLSACPGPVFCVDRWDDEADASYPSFMGACGHFPNLRAVRGQSPAAAESVPDVDMVFLDGAHAYPAVLADLAAWLPKTRRLLCGHDFGDGFPGVREAVLAVFPEERVVVAEATSIWTVDVAADRSVREDAPTGLIECVDEYGRDEPLRIEWSVREPSVLVSS